VIVAEYTFLMTLKAQILAYHSVFTVAAIIIALGAVAAIFTLDLKGEESSAEVIIE
jgi:hypothetical protein